MVTVCPGCDTVSRRPPGMPCRVCGSDLEIFGYIPTGSETANGALREAETIMAEVRDMLDALEARVR